MTARLLRGLAIVVLLGLVFGVMLGGSAPTADAGASIAPVNTSPYGQTYAQWSVQWWQWAYQYPVHWPNPWFTDGPTNCSIGQSARVWFLAGVVNVSNTANRTCSIPYGKALFFPLVNIEWDNVAVNPPQTIPEIRAYAKGVIDTVTELHATIDGVPVPNLSSYRVAAGPFAYVLPANDNIYQYFGLSVPGSDWPSTVVQPALSDGYWLFVNPLPVGVHTIKFGGTEGAPYNFSTDVTYTITVTP